MHPMYPPSSPPTPSGSTTPPPMPSSDLPHPLTHDEAAPDSPLVDAQAQASIAMLHLSLPSAASPTHDATTVTDELINHILVFAMRSTRSTHNHARLGQLLLAAPSEQCPDLLSAMLTQAWWLDLDVASRASAGDAESIRVLDQLMDLARRGVWTLQYSRKGLLAAAKRADIVVLEWWYRMRIDNDPGVAAAGSGAGSGVLRFADLTLDEMLECMQGDVAEFDVYDALHWYFVQHFQVDTMMVQNHQAFTDEARERMAGLQQVQRLLTVAAVRGFEAVLRGIGLKLASPAFAAMDIEAWTRIVASGNVQCAKVLWTFSPIPEPGRRSKDTLIELTRAAFASGSADMICWCARQFMAITTADNVRHFRTFVAACAQIAGMHRCLTAASAGGHLGLVQQLIADLRASGNTHYLKNHDILADEIAKHGHLEVVEWWEIHGKEFNIDLKLKSVKYTMIHVARAGDLPMVRWWWTPKTSQPTKGADHAQLMTKLIAEAAGHGHVDIVDYFFKQQQQQQQLAQNAGTQLTQALGGLVQAATERGQVSVLEWSESQSHQPGDAAVTPKLDWLKTTSRLGHVNVLQWWSAKSGSLVSAWVPDLVRVATRASQVGVICCLLGERGPMDSESDLAAEEGQVWAGFLGDIAESKVNNLHANILALLLQRWPRALSDHVQARQVKQRLLRLGLTTLAGYWTRMFPEFV
ncbi:hypothetical protein BCR44DRAFT_1424568 [Catenaria anguillulae PL171]|uniref:Uncharacterized protein n=1 Tax=Catenaria anguillulae PL171 TaxID=765915 RepID=A0A1Y2I463_9FUNG|nr:hypothetical protein BCR44DRAFT_1424568 [Catenaria anguillulae PL171]